MMCRHAVWLLLMIALMPMTVFAEDAPITVTVYNQDLGIVKEIRSLNIAEGLSDIRITDVPSRIDATSVKFRSLKDPKTTVVEQNYVFDLASEAKLLERFLDKTIDIITEDGAVYQGKLITGPQQGNLTLVNEQGGVVIVQRDKIRDIKLPELPEGLLTRPTLDWKIFSNKPGQHDCQIMYMTGGMNWNADYTLVIPEKDSKVIDLNGWVTINNTSGKTYPEAKIKLIAGDVHRAETRGRAVLGRAMGGAYAKSEAAPQVTERELFEYHLYELGHRTSLLDNQTKQVEFITANDVPAEKFFVYDGVGPGIPWYTGNRDAQDYGIPTNKKVQVYVEFMNKEANNLGKPLPAGKIRLFQKDEGQDFEFIGEDMIDHTPKDERVRLRVGNAFDIVGERRQTEFKKPSICVAEEAFEIKVRNHKKEPVEVRVVEHLYRWSEWKILESSEKYEKLDAKTIEFRVTVPPGEEGITITYRVRYNWC